MYKLYTLFSIISIILHTFGAYAQSDIDKDPYNDFTQNDADTTPLFTAKNERLNKAFIIEGIQDLTYTVSRPLHWQKNNWKTFSAVIITTGAFFVLDKKIKQVSLHNQNNFITSIANSVEPLGDIYGICTFPVLYLTGLAINNQKVQSIGLRGSKALAISSLLFTTSKNIIRRRRPHLTDNSFDYALPFSKSKYNSIPSGHTTIAFTIATTLCEEFPNKKWVPPVAYSLASLTGLSRIYHNRHWASDVFLGAALGYFSTKAVYTSGRKKHKMFKTFQ